LVHRGFVDLGYPDGGEEEDGEPPEANAASRDELGTIGGDVGVTYKAKNWITQMVWMPGERENMLSQMALRLAKRPDWDCGRLHLVNAAQEGGMDGNRKIDLLVAEEDSLLDRPRGERVGQEQDGRGDEREDLNLGRAEKAEIWHQIEISPATNPHQQ
jgi:hypothetical protein